MNPSTINFNIRRSEQRGSIRPFKKNALRTTSMVKFLIGAAFALVLFVPACTKDFEKINTDATLVTREIIKPSMLFTAVLKNSIFSSYNTSVITEYSGYYSNQGSGVIFQNANWTEPFNTYYRDYLINAAEVVRLTGDNAKLANEHAIGRIWKAWLFSQLTDAYGDIPYFEATMKVEEVINQPKYDLQSDIYKDLLKELKEATAELNADPSKASFGSADILFGGDIDRWKRFANSLRFRLAIRVRYADPALAQQNITDLSAAELIDDNSLNASLNTIDGALTSNRNPIFDDPTNSYPLWASFTATDNLKRLSDPRLSILAAPATDGISGYRGRPIALGQNEKTYTEESTAILPSFFREAVHNIIVLNAAEAYFLQAEAALAGLSGGDAQALYQRGIEASMKQYNVADAAITSYLNSAAGLLTGTEEEKLEQIIVQKWLAIYYESNEAWAEFRRTGYPRIWTGSDKGNTDGNIPRRLTYPLDEYAKNETNIKTAVTRLSAGDIYMSKVWWDAKAGVPFYHPKQGIFPPE